MNLEDELRAALRREEPSAGFAQRVVAHAEQSKPKAVVPIFKPMRFPVMAWAAAMAATLVVGVFVTSEYRDRQAERAGREAVVALRIAADKLNMTREKLLQRREN